MVGLDGSVGVSLLVEVFEGEEYLAHDVADVVEGPYFWVIVDLADVASG